MALLEKDMEDQLISQLTTEISQWIYRPDIKDEESLWNNFRDKLNQNNLDLLGDQLITDSEMEQIKNFMNIQAESPYKAAEWLTGEHRLAQIPLQREDATLGTVYLKAVNGREVAGGSSSYEVINQYQMNKSENGERKRRGDVTLLINGIPMIHIELKNQDHPFMDAFRQIKKYSEEGKFSGLMGMIQMFVVSNGSETRYIAAAPGNRLNEKFLTKWVDQNNNSVNDYLSFAKQVLNIPQAHYMVGKYSVLDSQKKSIILLRPYQIHAIEAVKNASKNRESGFIWHTTGSGKTLTSFTVTKNLLDIPSIDKTIFLIDRKDLDQQTSTDFLSYAETDDFDVTGTDNTSELEKQLSSKDRIAIVTTIQKLQIIIRRCTAQNLSTRVQRLKDAIQKKELAFVVDECHRSVTPETKREIDRFFGSAERPCLWFGFTGTPIFSVNKRAQKGDLPRTTEGLYGKCLHKYTIKEALKDGSVLGFQIQGLGESIETIQETARKIPGFDENEFKNFEAAEQEQWVINNVENINQKKYFDDEKHREMVVDYIINQSVGKLRLNAPIGQAYQGLLTCESIKEAQTYYKLFKKFKEEGRVSEDIRKILPDFPKVAITYTVGENEESAQANQQEMKQSLDDYNQMFGTEFDLSTIGAYNENLNHRLARKRSQYKVRDNQVDLVIVVDRLLTGFDSPATSTIFLDRRPMAPHHLIQAISRTNRLFDKSKRYGQVVTLQMPNTYRKCIDEALTLYSNGGSGEVTAPSWSETLTKLKNAVAQLLDFTEDQDALDAIQSKEDKRRFVKLFQTVDRLLSEAQVYDEFSPELLEKLRFSEEKKTQFSGYYQNFVEDLKDKEPTEENEKIDLDYELETISTIEVSYQYLVSLLQAHVPEDQELPLPATEDQDKNIRKCIEEYSKENPVIAEMVEQLWSEIQNNPENFRDKDVFTILRKRKDQKIFDAAKEFSDKWCVNPEELKQIAELGAQGEKLGIEGDYEAFKAQGNDISKLKYKKELRLALAKAMKEIFKPLI